MTDADRPSPDEPELETADKGILDDLIEKDAKSGRELTRFWYWFTAALGIFMVLFYVYNAGILPVDTQYHRGIYILITFVMVFVTYPMMKASPTDHGNRRGPNGFKNSSRRLS